MDLVVLEQSQGDEDDERPDGAIEKVERTQTHDLGCHNDSDTRESW